MMQCLAEGDIGYPQWEICRRTKKTLPIFINRFKAPFKLMLEVLHDALPDLAEDALFWRLHFAIGAMTYCMRLCSVGLPSSEILQPENDLGTVRDMLLDFTTSGMCAPCSGEADPAKTGTGR